MPMVPVHLHDHARGAEAALSSMVSGQPLLDRMKSWHQSYKTVNSRNLQIKLGRKSLSLAGFFKHVANPIKLSKAVIYGFSL